MKKLILAVLLIQGVGLKAQEIKFQNEGYEIATKSTVEATPVKSQGQTGTCWSFSTTSFIESEALRQGKGTFDLSEMYFVRLTYPKKADNYVRRQGNATFGAGSLSHDVLIASKMGGMMPNDSYSGFTYGQSKHNHAEMHRVLKGISDAVVNSKGPKSPVWKTAYEKVLDVYLGSVPAQIEHNNKEYTPEAFGKEVVGFDPDNYVEITSFTHLPYYKPSILNIPDNWANGAYYNVPLDELIETMNHALNQGYSIAWDGDVSEKTFSHKNGIAIIPEKDWEDMTSEERKLSTTVWEKEKEITPEFRQAEYDNQNTTDDHLMHIIGVVKDKQGTVFYLTKNSWGNSNDLGGYLFLSESYVRLKSIAILVHKDSLPSDLKKKLQL